MCAICVTQDTRSGPGPVIVSGDELYTTHFDGTAVTATPVSSFEHIFGVLNHAEELLYRRTAVYSLVSPGQMNCAVSIAAKLLKC